MLEHRLLIVTGKGGCGRSAIATSLALAASRTGRRTLAMALDDGAGLARHLGLPHLDPEPQRASDVWAARIDPATALDEYLRLRLRVPRLAPMGRVFAALVETVPGVRETVMVGKAIYESSQPRWDLVVLDGPPTGQVASFLGAPAAIGGLVPGGTVRQQAASLRSLLEDPAHTMVLVVATPEELPVVEAVEARRELASLVGRLAVVANRVLDDLDRIPASGAGPGEEAARWHATVVARQAGNLAALRPERAVPWLFGMHTPEETAARIADWWEAR